MKKEEITLTKNQEKVLNAIYEQAIDATGGDFGIVDEVMDNMKRSKMKKSSDKIKIKEFRDIDKMNHKELELLINKYTGILCEELTVNQWKILCKLLYAKFIHTANICNGGKI